MNIKTRLKKLEKITGVKEEKTYIIINFYTDNVKELIYEMRGKEYVRQIDSLSEEGRNIIVGKDMK
jgi:hypothetical protein